MVLEKLREKLKWLDPFTYVDMYVMPRLNRKNSETIAIIVYVFFAFVFAFLLYSALGFALGTPSPLVIVVSGSMEPVMYRGDIVLLYGTSIDGLKAKEVTLDESLLSLKPLSSYATAFCVDKISGEKKPCEFFRGTNARLFETASIKFFDGTEVFIDKLGDIVVYDSLSAGEPVIHRAVAKIKANDGYYLLTKGDSVLNPLVDQQAGIAPTAIVSKQLKGKAIFRLPLLGYVKLLIFDDLPVLLFGCKKPMGCSLP